MSAGASCTVTVDVVSTGIGQLNNTTGDLLRNFVTVGMATAKLDVTVTDISLTKSFTDDPVAPGDTANLEFTISNLDRTYTATNIAFTDDLDAALTNLAHNSTLTNTCGGTLSVTVTNTTNSLLSYSGGSLAAEGSCTINVLLDVPSGVATGAYTNTTSQITADVNSAVVTGNAASDKLHVEPGAPVLTKEFTDDPVGTGDSVTLEFEITNPNLILAASDIAFIDDLTAFLPFPVSVTLPATPCGGSISLIPLGTDRQGLSLTGGSLAASGTCTFTVTLDIPTGVAAGTYTNTTEAITATVDGATRTGNTASDGLEVVAAPSITKEFTDDPVQPGGTANLDFFLTHDAFAPASATNISFTDDLTATLSGLMFNSLLSDDCGGTLSGLSTLTYSGGSLAPGASCTVSATLDVPGSATSGEYTNTSSVITATVSGVTATGNAATDDLSIAGLTFTKEFIDDPVGPGDDVTLRFTIDNISPSEDATSIGFTDNVGGILSGLVATTLPADDFCGTGSTIAGTSFLNMTGGNRLAGESCTFDVTLNVPAGAVDGTYSNITSGLTATMDGTTKIFDPAVDALTVFSDYLSIEKSFTDDPVAPGGTVTLDFTIHNLHTTLGATLIGFTDDLDATLSGLTYNSTLSDDCGGSLSGSSSLTYTAGILASETSCTLSVLLDVPAGASQGAYTNTTSDVTGEINGSTNTGNAATDALEILPVVIPPSFSKVFSPNPAIVNDTSTLMFTIDNSASALAAGSLEFTDNLPSGLVVATSPNASTTCTGGTLTASAGTGTITYTGGVCSGGDRVVLFP